MRRRRTLIAAILGVGVAAYLAAVSFAAPLPVEGTNSTTTWTNPNPTLTTAESLTFKNSSMTTSHGVAFDSPPVAPSCTGVASSPAPNWEGSCTFSQAGPYPYHCTLHGGMTGTVTVTSAGPGKPIVSTSAATSVTDTTATLKGSVNPNGLATEYFFKYGTGATPQGTETGKTSVPVGSPVTASTPVSGLTAATTYKFTLFAENSSGTSEGAELTFTTAGPPTATTEPATGVGGTLATLAGVINPKGLETKYFFNYGETMAYGQKTTEKVAGSGTANVSKTESLTGLTPETTYHFQLVAKNSAVGGETKGIDRTVTTLGPPQATTGEAVGIGATGATLGGLVNAQGQDTSYYFNYGTTAAYGQKTATKAAGKGTTNTSVSVPVAGLTAETTYHFQLVVESGAGTDAGADKTFITTGTPPPPDPLPTPITPVITPPPPVTLPDTKITLKPPAKTKDRTPTFKFKSTVAGATFKCTLDGKALKPCRSPLTTKTLSFGRHTLKVGAVLGGTTDPTPAAFSFKVLRP